MLNHTLEDKLKQERIFALNGWTHIARVSLSIIQQTVAVTNAVVEKMDLIFQIQIGKYTQPRKDAQNLNKLSDEMPVKASRHLFLLSIHQRIYHPD